MFSKFAPLPLSLCSHLDLIVILEIIIRDASDARESRDDQQGHDT